MNSKKAKHLKKTICGDQSTSLSARKYVIVNSARQHMFLNGMTSCHPGTIANDPSSPRGQYQKTKRQLSRIKTA